jgi:hypothetical protein
MPKAAGSDLKMVRGAASRPAPPVRTINHQPRHPDGPHRNPSAGMGQTPSNRLASDTLSKARHPGSIDVRKRYDDPGNMN